MRKFLRHPFKALKVWLPKSMFGRALLILVAPLFFIETFSAYFFLDNHWDTVTKSLSNDVAGEVATVLDLYNKNPKEEAFYKLLAGRHLRLRADFLPEEAIQTSVPQEWRYSFMGLALKKQIFTPYTFRITPKEIIIDVAADGGVLRFTTPKKRVYSKSFFLFIMWVTGTTAIFLLISIIFLNNQIKPLRRLAIAADRFGRGRAFADLKPEGATEIRKVAQAFIRMRDRLQRQLTQRTEMLAGVSHDLRTPLTRMRLQLTMMPPSSEVEGLQKDVEEMGNMLEGYLTFAKGEGHEEAVETDMNEFMENSIEGRAQIDQLVHYDSKKLRSLWIKPQALKRCITNLINNACRYGSEVWVSAKEEDEQLIITVEDNGPGIPPEKIEDVFKPFYRLEASRNMSTGGVGLGLTIARDIIHHHGGDLILGESEDHGGLKAEIIIPF